MAFLLLRVFVLGVIAAAVDDANITWANKTAQIGCAVPSRDRVRPRRPPPMLDGEAPHEVYTWTRNYTDSISSRKVSSNGTLELRKHDGDGVYQCKVRLPAGFVLGYPVHLAFASMARTFLAHPADQSAQSGQPAAILCEIKSAPPAAVTWIKDDRPLKQDNRYHELPNQLLITDIRPEDAGTYKCKATNEFLSKTRVSPEGRLRVEESVDQEPSLLPISYEGNFTKPRGSRVVLPCPVLGWPRPRLVWNHLPPGGRLSELEHTDEVLVLDSLDDDLEGEYTCRVEGRDTPAKTFTVTLTEPPTITIPPTPKEAPRASTVRFNCTASGRPAPDISWYKDGQPLVLEQRINMLNSADGKRMELVIGGVTSDDAGVYQCFARTAAGLSSAWSSLAVPGPPAAAPRARCWPEGAAAVRVWWEPPPAVAVVAYTLHTTPIDAKPGTFSQPGQPHTNNEELVQLGQALAPFRFQVRAYIQPTADKKNVASDLSETVICQGQGVPLKMASLEDDSIIVSWKHFSKQNPGVMEWILQYWPEGGEVRNVTLPGSVYNYTFEGPVSPPHLVRVLGTRHIPWLHQNLTLVPWTSTSTAGTDLDDGDSSSVPRDLQVSHVTSRSLVVTWREEGLPYAFYVCAKSTDGHEECVESNIESGNSVKIERLEPDTEYEVRVQALINGRPVGGPVVVPNFVKTLSEELQRFKSITWEHMNATSVRVTWAGPPAPAALYYSPRLSLPDDDWPRVNTTDNYVLLTGLDPKQTLYVLVSEYESKLNSRIVEIPPYSGPQDLKYEYLTDGVHISWEGPGAWVVSYSQNLSSPVERWARVEVPQTSARNEITLSNLVWSLDTYVFVSRATNRTMTSYSAAKIPLTIPAQPDTGPKDLTYEYTSDGLSVSWEGAGQWLVAHSQNLTSPLERWRRVSVNSTGRASVQLVDTDPALVTYVLVTRGSHNGSAQAPLTVPARAGGICTLCLGVGISGGILFLALVAAAAVCFWRRRKRSRSPGRSRRRNTSSNEGNEEEGAQMKNIGGRLANGGKDAGEPLLNGHVHITENPTLKTPNGKMKRGRHFEDAFDVSRFDPDATAETSLGADTLLDTSRHSRHSRHSRLADNNSFSKLPDDNMNSEVTRSTRIDPSPAQPTLQPNG